MDLEIYEYDLDYGYHRAGIRFSAPNDTLRVLARCLNNQECQEALADVMPRFAAKFMQIQERQERAKERAIKSAERY